MHRPHFWVPSHVSWPNLTQLINRSSELPWHPCYAVELHRKLSLYISANISFLHFSAATLESTCNTFGPCIVSRAREIWSFKVWWEGACSLYFHPIRRWTSDVPRKGIRQVTNTSISSQCRQTVSMGDAIPYWDDSSQTNTSSQWRASPSSTAPSILSLRVFSYIYKKTCVPSTLGY